MSMEVRRVHPRVSYEQRIRLLGTDGRAVIVGRTMNLSPSGIYVRAPNGCEVGSEVTCDLPLPGGTRQIRGRVARTQNLPDETTGIGIQFVDLSAGDSTSLHQALEGTGPRQVVVKVVFEGTAKPVKCHGVVTAEGIRLSTPLPFLRLGSNVKAIYDGKEAKVDARGVLTGVRLEPIGGDGVPRLGVDVDIESETPIAAADGAALQPEVPPARAGDLSTGTAGRSFTSWHSPPQVEGAAPSVVTALDTSDVTAIVSGRGPIGALVHRLESLHAWGFVAVATLTFSIIYVAINRWGPALDAASGTGRARAGVAAVTAAAGAPASPLVPTSTPLVVPSHITSAGEPAVAAPPAIQAPPATAMPATTGSVPAQAPAAKRPPARRLARPRASDSPFRFDEASGRYRFRAGASLDMQGASLVGVGGLVASDDAAANLRGINVAVELGALYVVVTLPRPEADGHFAVQVTPSWPTPLAIVGKTTSGFTVSFGTPAPADAHLDWFLVR